MASCDDFARTELAVLRAESSAVETIPKVGVDRVFQSFRGDVGHVNLFQGSTGQMDLLPLNY